MAFLAPAPVVLSNRHNGNMRHTSAMPRTRVPRRPAHATVFITSRACASHEPQTSSSASSPSSAAGSGSSSAVATSSEEEGDDASSLSSSSSEPESLTDRSSTVPGRHVGMPKMLLGPEAVLGVALSAAVVVAEMGLGVAGAIGKAIGKRKMLLEGTQSGIDMEAVENVGKEVEMLEKEVEEVEVRLGVAKGKARTAEGIAVRSGGVGVVRRELGVVKGDVERWEKERQRLEEIVREEKVKAAERQVVEDSLRKQLEEVKSELGRVEGELAESKRQTELIENRRKEEVDKWEAEVIRLRSLLREKEDEVLSVRQEVAREMKARQAAEERIADLRNRLEARRVDMEAREEAAAELAAAREVEAKEQEEMAREELEKVWVEVESLRKEKLEREAKHAKAVEEASLAERSLVLELREEVSKKDKEMKNLQTKLSTLPPSTGKKTPTKALKKQKTTLAARSSPRGFSAQGFKPMGTKNAGKSAEMISLSVADLDPRELIGSKDSRLGKDSAEGVAIARQGRAQSERETPPVAKRGRGRPRKDGASAAQQPAEGFAVKKRGRGRPKMTAEEKAAAAKARNEKKQADVRAATEV